MMLKLMAAIVAAASLTVCAHATVTTYGSLTMYTTEAEFTAALAAANETVGQDNFDNLGSNLGSSLTRPAGTLGYTVSSIKYDTGLPDVLARTGTASDYALTTAPTKARRNENYPGNYLDFSSFSGDVNAVGVSFGELGSSTRTLVAFGLDDGDYGMGHTISSPLTTNFVGFISTGAMSDVQVYVYPYPAGVEPVVTGLYLGAAPAISSVPEPASWALLTGGFTLVGGMIRRRKVAASFA
jgi:hypothetical protein